MDRPISPGNLGLEHQVIFRLPVSDGSQIRFSLEKSYADRLIARAAAAEMSVEEYLIEMLKRQMIDPESPWNTIALPKDWMVCRHRRSKWRGKIEPLLAAILALSLMLPELFDYW